MTRKTNHTACIHEGQIQDQQFGGAISPIYLATSYPFMDVEEKRYPRYFNPVQFSCLSTFFVFSQITSSFGHKCLVSSQIKLFCYSNGLLLSKSVTIWLNLPYLWRRPCPVGTSKYARGPCQYCCWANYELY